MQLLKNLPIGYKAVLKDIRLINFSIDEEELFSHLPQLPVVKVQSKPVISLLDVKLYQLKPSFLLNSFRFNYRHIAFRVLIRDEELHADRINRGIFYLHSFTDDPFIAGCGKLFTNFNFQQAKIREQENNFSLYYADKWLNYSIDPDDPDAKMNGLMRNLVEIDRAYSLNGRGLKMTKVKRNDLPLQPLTCTAFNTNFFSTANFIDAYCVKQMLDYEWLPPQRCNLACQA